MPASHHTPSPPSLVHPAALLITLLLLPTLLPPALAHKNDDHKDTNAQSHRPTTYPIPTSKIKITPQIRNPGPPPGCLKPPYELPPLTPALLDTEIGVILSLQTEVFLSFLPPDLAGFYAFVLATQTSAWSSLAAYHPTFKPSVPTAIPRQPPATYTPRNRNIAIVYSFYYTALYIAPPLAFALATDPLPKLGLNPKVSCVPKDYSNPACVGIRAAKVTYNTLKAKGWFGCVGWKYNCPPFTDYTGFRPKNTFWKLKDIYAWQPLVETDRQGLFYVQQHDLPYAANIKPFVIPQKEYLARKARYTRPTPAAYKAQADELLTLSTTLDDRRKMLAEAFDNPATPYLFTFQIASALKWDLPTTLSYLQLIPIQTDAFLLTLKEKVRLNTVRPASAVRYLYGDEKVRAYAGPGQGTQWIAGNEWMPYLKTNNDAEHPSGAVCLTTVVAQWTERFLKTKVLNAGYRFGKGCSVREPGITPKEDVVGVFRTTDDLIKVAQAARMWGGVHFRQAVLEGNRLCNGLAVQGIKWLQGLQGV